MFLIVSVHGRLIIITTTKKLLLTTHDMRSISLKHILRKQAKFQKCKESTRRCSHHFCFQATFLPFSQVHPLCQVSQPGLLCPTCRQAVLHLISLCPPHLPGVLLMTLQNTVQSLRVLWSLSGFLYMDLGFCHVSTALRESHPQMNGPLLSHSPYRKHTLTTCGVRINGLTERYKLVQILGLGSRLSSNHTITY